MSPTTKDPLLQPFQLKGLTLRNRVMSTAHACGLADESGMPGEAYQRYHVEKARGGLALTMFGGSSYVSPDSVWAAPHIDISSDRIVPYLESFSQRVHAEGAAIMIQITHLGRRADPEAKNFLPALAPSPIRETLHRAIPREMDHGDIERIVKEFGEAAARSRAGGLDGLETMVAGHLIGQFLSPVTNKRTDEFGGSLDNRCRFGLMVHEEIRRRVGEDYIVGMRLTMDEGIPGGQDFEDTLAAARVFEASGLIDFLNVNYGRIDTILGLAVNNMPGMASPIAPWLAKAGAFKAEVGLPVFHAARISDIATARYAIREGLLDMVAMTRAHIADPDIVKKIERGEEERIRPCVGATHCMGPNRPSCIHNPASGRERFWPQRITRSDGPSRKVVVVGGGPAGCEAARVSAQRGHRVVLFEAASRLGGQLVMASEASWRKDIIGIVDWRDGEMARLGVEVRLNSYAEAAEVLAEEPDVVILATGGYPDLTDLPGAAHCITAWDALTGSAPLGDEVLVYDGTGRHTALTAAEFAARAGKAVTLVQLDEVPGAELTNYERAIWRRRLAEEAIPRRSEYRLETVAPAGNSLAADFRHELTGETLRLTADSIVVESGTLPADGLFQALRQQAANGGDLDLEAFVDGRPQPAPDSEGFQIFRIGDAAASRNLAAAIFDAHRLCSVL